MPDTIIDNLIQGPEPVPACVLPEDSPCGAGRQRFWYCDPYMRVCIDPDRGGAIVDLRAARQEEHVDADTPCGCCVGWPFLIREPCGEDRVDHRACEGTVRSARLCWKGEETDLFHYPAKAHETREGEDRILTLEPQEIVFAGGLCVKLQTVITFAEGSASIRYDRQILTVSDPGETVTVREYLRACCGAAEDAGDSGLILRIEAGEEDSVTMPCSSGGREAAVPWAEELSCTLPPIRTRVSMLANGRNRTGIVREGDTQNPAFTLGWERELREGEIFTTWINLEPAY